MNARRNSFIGYVLELHEYYISCLKFIIEFRTNELIKTYLIHTVYDE